MKSEDENSSRLKSVTMLVYESMLTRMTEELKILNQEEKEMDQAWFSRMEEQAAALGINSNENINLAIIGERGVGKSTLVNALTGAHALTGFVECTKKMSKYDHPQFPHLQIWDVPGYGTQSTPVECYFEQYSLFYMDYILLMVGDHLSVSDIHFANLCVEYNCPFFLVRSKSDLDVNNLAIEKYYDSYDQVTSIQQKDLTQEFAKITHNYMATDQARAGLSEIKFFVISAMRISQITETCSSKLRNRKYPSVDEEKLLEMLLEQIITRRSIN